MPNASDNTTPPMTDSATLIAILQGLAEGQRQQTEFQRVFLERQANRSDPGIRQLRGLHPKSFSGKEQPLDAEEWRKSTENDLTAAQIPKSRWVEIGKMQLTDIARIWWETQETRLDKPIAWDTFKELFNAKYFSEIAKMELHERFVNLKQDTMTVDEYDTEFSMLKRFAPEMVATPIHEANLFRRGLDLTIHASMTSATLGTQVEVLNAAKTCERIQKEIKNLQLASKKNQPSREAPTKAMQTTSFKKTGASGSGSGSIVCFQCGRLGHKRATCREFLGQCVACGSDHHQLRDCPNRRTGPAPASSPASTSVQRKESPLPNQQQAYQKGRQKDASSQIYNLEKIVAGNPDGKCRPTLLSMLEP